ncbi:hypothetical protein [Arthrobacter pityocampae]
MSDAHAAAADIASITTGAGLLALAGYALIYCIPCLVLLGLGVAHADAS